MEENQSKKSGGVSLVLVIAILVIALVACFAYIMKNSEQEIAINNDNSEQTINELRTEIANLKNILAQKENEIKNYENEEPVTQTKEMTSDEKYEIFAQNLKKEVSKYGDTANCKTTYCRSSVGEGSWYEVKLNSNGNLSLRFGDEKLDKKYGTNSLVKNVLAFYIIDVGQDEWHEIFFINEDGTVGSAYLDSVIYDGTGKIEIRNKISGLKNIVSIINGATGLEHSGGYCPLFIDIDGNVFNIYK